jgi:hypothetical protein
MKLDRSELLLKTTATHFLTVAVKSLHLSLRAAVAFERTSNETIKEEQAQQAAYFQLLALQADESARMCGIESDEMHKFMHLFFATNVDWSQIK